ncbi:MAG TPA: hypothetical protein HPP97_15350 [Desulfuromonadales bacterium]|nr:hypothetical protein [Desulfuromonadales bacterium]
MAINGLYEIVEMEIWDGKDSTVLAERARISIQGRKGKLHFIGFDGQMDITDAKDRYLFTWVGNNEADPISGYGNFTSSGDILTGRIYMHDGQDSAFVAVKMSQEKKQITTVNRSLLIVKAREPFREWVASLPGKGNITIRDLNTGCKAYLVPEFEGNQQRDDLLERLYADLFVEQLFQWCIDDVKWPRNRTFALFNRWFEPEFYPVVEDTVECDIVGGTIH